MTIKIASLSCVARAVVFTVMLMGGLVATSTDVAAQSWGYGETSWSFTDISGTGRNLGLASSDARVVALPFTLPWFGRPYEHITVSSKGYVLVGDGFGTAGFPDPIPTVGAPNDFVAPFWADLNPAAGGAGVYVQTLGSAPNRRFVVQWNNVPFTGTGVLNTFQLVIHEGSGYMEVKLRFTGAGRMHTVGLENGDATDTLLIDRSSNGFFERSWVLQGVTTLDPAECGTDTRYDCYVMPFEFDSVMDEIYLPPDYQVTLDYNYEWQAVPNGSRTVVRFRNVDQVESSAAVALPFPFRLYETDVTQLYIGDHGYVSFENVARYINPAYSQFALDNALPPSMPVVDRPTDAILAPAWSWWAPDSPGGCGQVFYGTVGTAPDRRFVITWDNVCTWAEAKYGYDLANARFQIVLYEATGEIRYNYDTIGQLGNLYATYNAYYAGTIPQVLWWTFDTTVGLEDHAGTRGSNVVGGENPTLTATNYQQYSLRMVYTSRPDGVGRKVFATPFRVDSTCQDAVTSIGAADGMFPFRYYDQASTSTLYMSTNGLMGFTSAPELASYTGRPFPSTALPNNVLSPGWTDLLPCGGGEVAYTMRGDAGSRQLVTQWSGIPQEKKVNATSTTWYPSILTSTQAMLFEGSGAIQFNIQEIELLADATDLSVGVEDLTGNAGIGIIYDPTGNPRFYNQMSRRFVRHCHDSGVTLGGPCNSPLGGTLQGVCGSEGVWTCVAGQAVCAQTIFPSTDICDGLDNNCNGQVDEPCAVRWWLDADGDGFGDDLISVVQPTAPPGFVDNNLDCDDTDEDINPAAVEICDGKDNNCNGQTDEGLLRQVYEDRDGDTFGAGPLVWLCVGNPNRPVSDNNRDCNDADAGINPAARELCDNKDNDCNGLVDDNLTDVGRACIDPTKSGICATGTTRCVNGVPFCDTLPPRPETCDGDDNDCDGFTDEVDDAPLKHRHPEIGLYVQFDAEPDDIVRDIAGQPDNGRLYGATRLPGGGRYLDGVHIEPRQYIEFVDGGRRETDLASYDTYTLALWIKVEPPLAGNFLIMERTNQFRIRLIGGEPTFQAPGLVPAREYRAGTQIQAGVWQHIAYVYTGTQIRWYINGVNVRSWDEVLDPFTVSPFPLRIGSSAADGARADIDEFILWRTALAPDEINEIYVPPGTYEAYSPGGNVRCDADGLGICAVGLTWCSAADGYKMVCKAREPLGQELCNGLDDDCDGQTDEPNFAAEQGFGPGGGGSCLTGQSGVCRPGRNFCINGAISCRRNVEPSPEVCDGLDNDCNGQTDEADPLLGVDCSRNLPGVCATGAWQCLETSRNNFGLVCVGPNPGDLEEICNGLDDDCDGLIDEGVDGSPLTRACGCFGTGSQLCIDGEWSRCSARFPTPEVCDNMDNDCDGLVDEGIVRACSTGCGDGVQTCSAGQFGVCSAPEPSLELCDGVDNDCDGDIDEDLNCGCRVYPTGGDTTPAVTWEWSPSDAMEEPDFTLVVGTPLVAPIYETNRDGVVNTDDRPMIVAMTADRRDPTVGILRVFEGVDGRLRTTLPQGTLSALATPVVADLGGTLRPDVVAYGHPLGGGGVYLFEATGEIVWHNTDVNQGPRPNRGALAVGEISAASAGHEIVGCGFALTASGAVIFDHADQPRSPWCSPDLVDLDGDGDLEIVIGARAWDGDGTELWTNPDVLAHTGGLIDAQAGVVDIDGDGDPEVVVVSRDVFVLDGRTGATLARATLPGGGSGGAPNLSDIDDDGRIEIVVAGTTRLVAMEYVDTGVTRTLQTSWAVAIQDGTGGVASATTIDLDYDGIQEVLFADELYFRIVDGAAGVVVHQQPNWGVRGMGMPVVADVDEDGATNVVMTMSGLGGFEDDYPAGFPGGAVNRLRVLRGATTAWPLTRKVWNAHSYHVTNILDSMQVPDREVHHWTEPELNRYRSNPITNITLFDAPDLTMSIQDFEQGDEFGACPALNRLTVEVCNIGAVDVPAGVQLVVFAEPDPDPDPNTRWEVVETLTQGLPHLAPDNCQIIQIEFVGPVDGLVDLFVAIDPAGLFVECREDNNQASRPFAVLRAPEPEKCDGVDNDCDGDIDEDDRGRPLERECSSECGRSNERCEDGRWSGCRTRDPEPEVCDGVDNDCDGIVDNEDAACDGGQTCVCQVVGNELQCGCIDTLTVPGGCGVGCPLGFMCQGEACVPWCYDDFGCAGGERCQDHACVATSAPAADEPSVDGPAVQPSVGGCSTGSGEGAGGLFFIALSAVAGFLLVRRR